MTDRQLSKKWSDSKNDAQAHPPHPARRAEKASAPRYKVSDLLGSGDEAVLEHGGEEYRLRITSNRKLILTK